MITSMVMLLAVIYLYNRVEGNTHLQSILLTLASVIMAGAITVTLIAAKAAFTFLVTTEIEVFWALVSVAATFTVAHIFRHDAYA